MSSYTAIDLSQLPAPACVETYNFEDIYSRMKNTLNGLLPQTFSETTDNPVVVEAEKIVESNGTEWFKIPTTVNKLLYVELESDPAAKVLAVCAYRECLLRQKINESLKAVMLAYAVGADLDQHGANYNLQRLLISPGDADAIPPVEPVYESDNEFRRRILLVFESLSVAGPEGAYLYHTLNADPGILDAAVKSPAPGEVLVTIMGRTGNGTANAELIKIANDYLQSGNIRPLTDYVTVQSVTVIEYQVTADLMLYNGPDSSVVLADAVACLANYVNQQFRINLDVTLSGIYAALHTGGVANVILHSPTGDIITTDQQAAYCTATNIAIKND